MISKELLETVLGKEINRFNLCDNYIYYDYPHESEEDGELIWILRANAKNIHELAHKCKDWAWKNKFLINSDILGYALHGCLEDKLFKVDIEFKADTEPEAIFKACQWILDTKKGM